MNYSVPYSGRIVSLMCVNVKHFTAELVEMLTDALLCTEPALVVAAARAVWALAANHHKVYI